VSLARISLCLRSATSVEAKDAPMRLLRSMPCHLGAKIITHTNVGRDAVFLAGHPYCPAFQIDIGPADRQNFTNSQSGEQQEPEQQTKFGVETIRCLNDAGGILLPQPVGYHAALSTQINAGVAFCPTRSGRCQTRKRGTHRTVEVSK
jgi:hypothetical protein